MTDFEELNTQLEILLKLAKNKDNSHAELTFMITRRIVSACMKLELHVTNLEERIEELERKLKFQEIMYGT